jgi:predicted protein tyrosine phosphatase
MSDLKEEIMQELHQPDIPEVIATREDAIRGSSFRKRFRHALQQFRKQGVLLTLVEGYEQITRQTTGAPTVRFTRIQPNLYVGGQFLARGWPILANRGVTAVVSMRGEYDDREAGIAPPRYLHLPTVDNHAPTLKQLQQGVDFIRQEIESGGGVYIHCWEGVGRAPTMAAAYLVSTGVAPLEAWRMIRRVRPFIRPLQAQIDQLERFAAMIKVNTV